MYNITLRSAQNSFTEYYDLSTISNSIYPLEERSASTPYLPLFFIFILITTYIIDKSKCSMNTIYG